MIVIIIIIAVLGMTRVVRMLLLLLVLSGGGVLGQDTNTDIYIPNGIFNPQEINLDLISARLVSPQGLVTQFALELETQTIFTTGWLVSGALWQYAMLNTEGETQRMLSGLDFLFSTQNLATTVVRSLFDATRSLLSRLTISFFVFGWDETVSTQSLSEPRSVILFLLDQWNHADCRPLHRRRLPLQSWPHHFVGGQSHGSDCLLLCCYWTYLAFC